jgi:hypothetical protein
LNKFDKLQNEIWILAEKSAILIFGGKVGHL